LSQRSHRRQMPPTPDNRPSLSAAERVLGRMLVDGCGDDDIARWLLRSPQSVEWAVAKLCRKLDVGARADLIALLDRLDRRRTRPIEQVLRAGADPPENELANEGGDQ
jgi:DNA-binding NarL/FixJ family response regulator